MFAGFFKKINALYNVEEVPFYSYFADGFLCCAKAFKFSLF